MNAPHLKQVHEQRRQKSNQQVTEAIKRLVLAQEPINFNSVSKKSGVSKATLYNHDTIRERIEHLRPNTNNHLLKNKPKENAQMRQKMR